MDEPFGVRPQTVWDHCLLWADLLVTVHVQHRAAAGPLTPEQQATWDGPDRPLTLVLLAAALHRQAGDQELATPQTATGLWLHTPGPDTGGVEQLLRYRPYQTLRKSSEDDRAGAERARLLGAAWDDSTRCATPDGLILWQRVHAAALAVVEGVTAPGRGTSITMQDILASQVRQESANRLRALQSPED